MEGNREPLSWEEKSALGGWRLPVMVAVVVGLALLGGIVWLVRPGPGEAPTAIPATLPPLNPEAEAYVSQIEFSGLQLSRWENFLGQTVIYLDGTVTNHGSRRILALDLTLEFLDPQEQVVLRQSLRAVGRKEPFEHTAALPPNQSRSFRAAFEHLPADWDHALPRMRISGLLLE